MAFTPRLVERVRKRAHFQCCLCKAIGVEIHHIVPQAESGPDTEENAAPLCPSCHETYGANPTKRKLIREARDHWYEVCDKRYAPDQSVMKEVQSAVSATASKEDLQSLKKDLIEGLSMVITAPNQISVGTPSDSCPGATHLLSTNDLLITLFDHKSQRDDAQANLLCLEGLWPEKGGLRSIRDDFVVQFGEFALRRQAIRVLDELKIEKRQGLSEEEVIQAMHLLSIQVALMVMHSKGQVFAGLTEDREILWQNGNK